MYRLVCTKTQEAALVILIQCILFVQNVNVVVAQPDCHIFVEDLFVFPLLSIGRFTPCCTNGSFYNLCCLLGSNSCPLSARLFLPEGIIGLSKS